MCKADLAKKKCSSKNEFMFRDICCIMKHKSDILTYQQIKTVLHECRSNIFHSPEYIPSQPNLKEFQQQAPANSASLMQGREEH